MKLVLHEQMQILLFFSSIFFSVLLPRDSVRLLVVLVSFSFFSPVFSSQLLSTLFFSCFPPGEKKTSPGGDVSSTGTPQT